MDIHLEKEIRLNDKTKYGDHSWCLEEIDSNGEVDRRELIPWNYGVHFTASEFRIEQGLTYGEPSLFDELKKENAKFEDIEGIKAILHPGVCTDGKQIEDNPTLSMFGTDRPITDFSLRIFKREDGEREGCGISGYVGYTAEVDFSNVTSSDGIEIRLGLSQARYDRLFKLISTKSIDHARVYLSRVCGFYAEWSPSIRTNTIKVLTHGGDQQVITPDGCDVSPPRLGSIGEFHLVFITRSKLNPKQDFTTINISKVFDEDDDVENEITVAKNLTPLAIAKIAQSQIEIVKLKIPLWIVAILLGVLHLCCAF